MSGSRENEITVEKIEPIPLSNPPEFVSADHSSNGNINEKANSVASFWGKVKHVVFDPWKKMISYDGTKRMKVYQVWPGNNVFFFRGQFICGPHPRGLVLTAVSIGLSSWIFGVYIVHDYPEHSSYIIIFSVILTVAVLANLIVVSTIDPGIIPRNEEHTIEVGETCRKPKMTIIHVNGVEVKSKYCRICNIYRPPRSCHCAICDNCVERFDHHCPLIGQCIGLRNYRFYLSFLVVGFVFFLYIAVYCFWRIHQRIFKEGIGLLRLLRNSPETVALALFSFGSTWFMACFASYHIYLICTNQTLYDNFRERYLGSKNPYDKGILVNFKEALFSSLPPSRVHFRAEITPNGLGSCHN